MCSFTPETHLDLINQYYKFIWGLLRSDYDNPSVNELSRGDLMNRGKVIFLLHPPRTHEGPGTACLGGCGGTRTYTIQAQVSPAHAFQIQGRKGYSTILCRLLRAAISHPRGAKTMADACVLLGLQARRGWLLDQPFLITRGSQIDHVMQSRSAKMINMRLPCIYTMCVYHSTQRSIHLITVFLHMQQVDLLEHQCFRCLKYKNQCRWAKCQFLD